MPESHGGETLTCYLYLAVAIIGEVVGTSALKASDGLTKVAPSAIVFVGYAVAFISCRSRCAHSRLGLRMRFGHVPEPY
jgi:multidrug transporter EmrE-like cation transporter